MIDIHSHILPGIDDGAGDLEESLKMAEVYVKAGYRQVVATPHALPDVLKADYARNVRNLVSLVNWHCHKRAILLRVLPGMEVGMDPDLAMMVDRKKILTLAGGPYLLVETPFHHLPWGLENLLFALATRNIQVIFAHPERCAYLAAKPEVLKQMAWIGAKFQLTWDSFAGAHGPEAQKAALAMAAAGQIHCLATDSHDAVHRSAGPVEAIAAQLQELVGADNLQRIAVENPDRVVRGLELLDMDPAQIRIPRRRRRRAAKAWWSSKAAIF